MKVSRPRLSPSSMGLYVPVSILVLLVSLSYFYAANNFVSYSGVFITVDWVVGDIIPCEPTNSNSCQENQGKLQVGDQLSRIGDLTFAKSMQDRSLVPFGDYQPGQLVPITFLRDGQEHTIEWRMQGATDYVWLNSLEGFLVFVPFWLVGTVILFLLQPHDLRWRLLILFNYGTALWLSMGLVSVIKVAYSSLLLHALSWLLAPLYLQLHLTIPSPLLRRFQGSLWPPLFAAGGLLAILELAQLLPPQTVNVAYLLMVLGALVPLGWRFFQRESASDRIAVRLMLAGILLAFGPGFILVVVPSLMGMPLGAYVADKVSLFAIPLLPAFYTYAIYKRRLGNLEFRANRVLGLFSFALLYATPFVLVYSVGASWLDQPGESLVYNLFISLVFALAAMLSYRPYQHLFERLAYGARFNPEEIVGIFVNRISAALERGPIVELLTHELMPSLLIRQSALYLICSGEAALSYASGVQVAEHVVKLDKFGGLIANAGRYMPPEPERQGQFDWVRLVIEIKAGDNPVALWLLGRRDPDDFYPQPDIALLKTLGNQIGLALENARLFEGELMRREELSALYDLSRALADAAYDLQAILDLVTRRAVEDVHVTFARAALMEGDELVMEAGHPIRMLEQDLGAHRRLALAGLPLCRRVLEQNVTRVVPVASPELGDYEREALSLGIARTLCLIPVRAGENTRGLLLLAEARREEREPFSPEKVLLAQSIADLTRSAIHRAGLFAELESSYLQTVLALASAVEAKDTYTANHAQRLAQMAVAVGSEMGMDSRALEDLRYGAILHDIGKIGVPDSILQKPSKLDAGEWVTMRQHPVIGAHILSPIPRLAGASHIVCHHHERYDGRGYPDGLAGDQIPLGARILSVVDAYSAIIDQRKYKEARTPAEAVAELVKNAGTQFDPRIVELFLRLHGDAAAKEPPSTAVEEAVAVPPTAIPQPQ